MKILLFALLGLTACSKPSPQPACGFTQNVYGERLIASIPVAFKLDNSLTVYQRDRIYSAIETLETSTGLDLFKIVNDSDNLIFMSDNIPNNSNALGLAHRATIGNRIYRVNIQFNKSLLNRHHVNFKTLAMHELAHAIGLAHNDSPDSIMTTAHVANVLNPSKEDIANLQCGYGKE